MSGRCVRKVLRSGENALKNITEAPSRRTFASSARCQKHGSVPSFSQTSSPELDSILSTFRHKVFLPAALSKQQQDLIYKEKNKKLLSAEPVTARIRGEEFVLTHINKSKDLINPRKAFFQAVDLMKEKKDWDQIPSLLEGLKSAGRSLQMPDPLILIRKAALAGRMDVMIECARRVEATGLRLNDPELVAALMWGIQYKAIVSDFAPRETKKALEWAERIMIMLQEDNHAGRRVIVGTDPRTKLEVVGALLQLAAVRSAKHLKGKDEDGMVEKYAERLLGTVLQNQPPQLSDEEGQLEPAPVHEINIWLSAVVPVLHGMRVAQTVLESTSRVAMELKETTEVLESTLNTQREVLIQDETLKDRPLSGLKLYEQLLRAEGL